MTEARMEKFETIKDQIQSGDIFALHDEFAPTWYGLKIEAVQVFTGKFCHVGILDVRDGEIRAIESVIPLIRDVPLLHTVGKGFFWIPMNRPLNERARRFMMSKVGVGGYSQIEAIRAGLDMVAQTSLPNDNQRDHLWECARFVRAVMVENGVFLGDYDVPTKIVEACRIGYNAPAIEVTM